MTEDGADVASVAELFVYPVGHHVDVAGYILVWHIGHVAGDFRIFNHNVRV